MVDARGDQWPPMGPVWTPGEYARYDEWLRDGFPEEFRQLIRLPVPRAAEAKPPTGRAARWLAVVGEAGVSPSAYAVAQQLARLSGRDVQVSVPWRSLADAVSQSDSAKRVMAYTQAGVRALERAGFVRRQITGKGRAASTTYFLTAPVQCRPTNVQK